MSNSLQSHGLQLAKLLCPWNSWTEWVAIPFCRESSWPRPWTQVSCIAGRFFTIWATREEQFSPTTAVLFGYLPRGWTQYPLNSSLFLKPLFFTRPSKWAFYNMEACFVTPLTTECPSISLWSSSSLDKRLCPGTPCGKFTPSSWVHKLLCGPLTLHQPKCLPHLFFFFLAWFYSHSGINFLSF